MTFTWKSRAAVCPRTSVAPRVPAVATSERNGSGAGGRISPLMPGIDVPRKVIAMIVFYELIRFVCIVAFVFSVPAAQQYQGAWQGVVWSSVIFIGADIAATVRRSQQPPKQAS